ncbi:DUF7344 domain-containing protein [Natronomonas salsuginis]|jgi:hypothetical protein|uniref:DUF7344 domain-containing protein n=1 Tax=Natronomonas salsuginis TaxID=2217661 RepID=UPI001C9E5478|nr:hypothetical protein [Natronomonas salsuginis]
MIEAVETVVESVDSTSDAHVSPALTEDELFDVLSNRRRRYAIHFLKREDAPVGIGTLAEQIAAWENEIELHAVSCAQRKRVYTALQQIHLPQMAEAGVIEFDDRSGVVEPTIAMGAMDIYVDLVEGRDIPWSGYYLGLSVVGLAVMTAAWIGLWPLSTLPDIALGIFMFVTVAVFAAAHHYHMTRQRLGRTEKPAEIHYLASDSDSDSDAPTAGNR